MDTCLKESFELWLTTSVDQQMDQNKKTHWPDNPTQEALWTRTQQLPAPRGNGTVEIKIAKMYDKTCLKDHWTERSDVLPSREMVVWRSAKKHLAERPAGQHQGDGKQQLQHESDVTEGSVEGYVQWLSSVS